MADDPNEFVSAFIARDVMEAEVVASLLEGEGIPTLRPGRYLMDEWASASQALNRLGTEVKVPASRLEEAKAVIASAREDGKRLDTDTDPGTIRRDSTTDS